MLAKFKKEKDKKNKDNEENKKQNIKEDRKKLKYLLSLLVSGVIFFGSSSDITGKKALLHAQEISSGISKIQVSYSDALYIDSFMKERVKKIYVDCINLSGLKFPVENLKAKIKTAFLENGYSVIRKSS